MNMTASSLAVTVLALVSVCECQEDLSDVLLLPVKEGVDAGLTVVCGAYLAPWQYREIGEQIQNASDLRLWVYVSRGPILGPERSRDNDTAAFGIFLENGLEQLTAGGFPSGSPYFGAGHSLGGVSVFTEVSQQPTLVTGTILWAANILTSYDDSPSPVMTLNGDVDGQQRVVVPVMQAREIFDRVTAGEDDLKFSFPLYVPLGVNHAVYATGPEPMRVQEYDIPLGIPAQDARLLIANATATFIAYHSKAAPDRAPETRIIEGWYEASYEFAQPIFAMFDLEETDSGDNSSSPWSSLAQTRIAAVDPGQQARFQTSDDILTPVIFLLDEPELLTDSADDVTSLTKTFIDSTSGASADTPLSADGVDSKLRSHQAVTGALTGSLGPPDIPATCRDVVNDAWQQVWAVIPQFKKDRFFENNVTVVLADDIYQESAAEWNNSTFLYQYDRSSKVLTMQASVLFTPEGQEQLPGMHYCKLLSPARALEFIYIDGLRQPFP